MIRSAIRFSMLFARCVGLPDERRVRLEPAGRELHHRPPPSLALRSARPPGELPLRNARLHHQRTDAHRDERGHQSSGRSSARCSPPSHLIFADSSSAFCSSSSRAALTWFLCTCQAPLTSSARLCEAVVDRDSPGADVGDRRLGPLARVPVLRRGRRLQPLEVGVPAAELVLDGARERRPLVGDVCDDRVLGDGEPRLQLPELLVELVGREPATDGCLLPAQRVEVAADSRAVRSGTGLRECLQPVDPAADLRKLVVDRGRAHVRASCWLFSDATKARRRRCQRSARRGGASASST